MTNQLANIRMVSASAGTGKTYYLTNVVADQIAAGTPASGILATTFTRKAAGELKERIAAKLLDRSGQEHTSGRLRDAAQQLSVSLIGTVNSVCSQLLREYAIDAGLSPALEQIPEGEQQALFRMATDSVLADYSHQILPIAQRLSQATDSEWVGTVQAMCDAARMNLLDSDILRSSADRSWEGFRQVLGSSAPTDDRASWLNRLRQNLAELEHAARTGIDSSGKPVNTTAKNFASIAPEIVKKISAMDRIEDISWEQWRGVIPSGASKWIVGLFEGVRTEIREGLLRCPAFQDDVEQYTRLVFACAADCLEAYADFKRNHGLMDFVDQETLTVELARHNEAFRGSFRQRVKFMVVDEFQDTNPLQLELFLQLSRLVDQVVWVGDPKQAIYEFRGTDPELMNAIIARVEDVDRLDRSWRSQQAVLDLSNSVFEPLFELSGMRRDDVHLTIPPERSTLPHGSVEAWTREGRNDGDRLVATAVGVGDLLARRPDLRPCDVAVLARTNAQVTALAQAFDGLGIRASANTRPLLAAREIQLVRAAMAFIADPRDTVALTELVALHPAHHAHTGWQEALLGTDAPAEALEGWAQDAVALALAGLREKASRSTPGEIFERTVGLLGLPELIKSWSVPATRLRNLDSLRASLTNYYEQCEAVRRPATLRGFLTFLDKEEHVGAENVGDDVVNVLTYHKAKGLEWPVVVMESLDKAVRADALGLAVEQDGTVNVDEPLSGRWIRFWPNPFPWGGSPLTDSVQVTDTQLRAEERGRRNLTRLMYVGMTRSAETTVLTGKGDEPSVLNQLGVPDLVSWRGTDDDGHIGVAGSAALLPAKVLTYSPDDAEAPAGRRSGVEYTDPVMQKDSQEPLPSRIRASSQVSADDSAAVLLSHDLGGRLIPAGGDERWNDVGSAMHSYLGTRYDDLPTADRRGLAQRIIGRWGVDDLIQADTLVAAGERLSAFLSEQHPESARFREVPVAWRTKENQTMEGWIDLLLETGDGYVLMDHKTFPGEDPAEHIREKYLGQMDAYRQAVLAATGKPVIQTLIHLPALGKMYSIEPTGNHA